MSRLIEENDIDEWFLERKTILAEAMMNALLKGAEPKKEREKFNREYWKLFAKYDKMHQAADLYKLRQQKLKAPFIAFTAWHKEKKLACQSLWRRLVERIKKEWFEYRYRRMFHIRQRKI